MRQAETVDKRILLQLVHSLQAEARSVQGAEAEGCTPIERRLRAMHARCFNAAADRLKQTIDTGQVPRGCY